MPRKRKSDRGYCLLCPTKGEYQGLKSKSSFLSSHAPSQGHQNAYRQWIHTRRSNGSTYGESFPLASAEDFFEEANDMERSAIVNDHFDWDLWYQPIKVYRTGRPTTPPLPSPSPPPPASPSRQPSPPQPTLQQRSGNTDSTTAATASPTLSFSANVNPRPSAASSSEQHSDKHAPKRDIHDQYQPSNSEMNDDNNDNNDNDNDGDNDDDESELISLAQRYSGEPSISRALARLQIGNSVLNLPNIGHFHPAVTLAQTGARELTAPSTSRANNDDNNVDDRMDVDLEESERATLPPSGADDPQAQIDEMRQALAEQQAATAADAIHFTFAQPSLEWPPMGPVFPWESNVNAIIFTQLARNLHDQTRSKVQFALDMVKALHPEDDLPTARRALTLPVGFPAPRIATVSVGEGDEFSIILPSDMIKLLVCRPDIYKQLICFPTDSINIIDSFCDTQRARELFKGFKTTTFRNSAGVNFFVGNIVEYHFASESCLMTRYGRIRQIYQAKGDGSIMIELSRIAKSADLVPANPDLIDLDTPGAEPTYWDTGELYKIKATDLVMEPRPHGVVVLGHVDILKGTHSRFTQMEHDDYHAPHHLQQCGLPILTAFIAFWFDEAKGTTSNRHDSHETAAFQLLNVPSSLNRTPKNIGFVAAVNERSASCYDIAAAAFKDIADNLEKGIPWVVPTESGGAQRVMITGGIGCFTGDSPKVCLYCSHMGVRARFNCPFCMFDQNTMDLSQSGKARTKEDTLSHQDHLMQHPPSKKDQPLKSQGVQVHPDQINPFMSVANNDPHKDSPLDALHLGPLGLAKFVAEHLIGPKPLSRPTLIAAKCVDSCDWSSFEERLPGTRLVEHWGSFVGRDLKIFIQMSPGFARSLGYKPRYAVLLACTIAGFSRLLYARTSQPLSLKEYRADIKRWGNAFFHVYKQEPALKLYMNGKIKPHYMVHAEEVPERYGNLNLYATETMERLNRLIRQSILTSNHRNTSKSVASDFATQAGIEYIKEGGLWIGPGGRICQGGELVRSLLQDVSVVSEYVEPDSPPPIPAGSAAKTAAAPASFSTSQGNQSDPHRPGHVFFAEQQDRAHRPKVTPAAHYKWPCGLSADDVQRAMQESGHVFVPCAPGLALRDHYVQTYKSFYDQNSEPVHVGWSVIYHTTDGKIRSVRRGRVLRIVQLVGKRSNSGRLETRCFAVLARYSCRYAEAHGGRAIDNYLNMDKLTASQLEKQFQRDEFGGIKLWLDLSKVDVIPTLGVVQSFAVFHRCTTKCGIAPSTTKATFATLPVEVKAGEWRCDDDLNFAINHYRFTEPFPPLLPAALSEALALAAEEAEAQSE